MGCGNSTEKVEDPQSKKSRPQSGEKTEATLATASPTSKKYAPGEEDDPELMNPLSRKESAATKADEPSDFVAKMKHMYQIRKAKFNGANEDLDQYEDEIRDSIPVLNKRDKQRIQDWVNSINTANPDNIFEEVVEGGLEPTTRKQRSPTSQNPGPMTAEPTTAGLDASAGPAGSDAKTTPAVVLQSDPSPTATEVTHPHQVYDANEIVPLLQVTSAGNYDKSSKDGPAATPHSHRRAHSTHDHDPHDASFSSAVSKSRRESVSMTSGGMMTPPGQALDATDSDQRSHSNDGSDTGQNDSGGMKLGW
jgi:hypothetical protein